MPHLIEPKEHESVLEQWRGTTAKVVTFHISLRRLMLTLSRKSENEALFVLAVSCEWIKGPFAWGAACIELVEEQPNQFGEVKWRVIDTQAGFEVICSGIAIARGIPWIIEDPFRGVFDPT